MQISEFLRTLTVEEEDRVLTGKMAPMHYGVTPMGDGPCLVGTACDYDGRGRNPLVAYARMGGTRDARRRRDGGPCVEDFYDTMCARFGAVEVNAAIRGRILANRCRKELKDMGVVRAHAFVGSIG